MGQFPFPGTAKKLEAFEKNSLLDLAIEVVPLKMQPAAKPALTIQALLGDALLNRVWRH